MLSREPNPPPQGHRKTNRELHTSLQLPSEARWSRPSSIILSVLVHVALFLFIRHLVWKPVEKPGPVFQVFQLDASPREKPVAIKAPAIEVPPRANPDVVTAQKPTSPEKEKAVASITEPTSVPATLPAPGAAIQEPTLLAPQVPQGPPAPMTAAERFLRNTINPALVPATPGLPPMGTPREAAEARLAAGIKAYNDSVAGIVADARRAKDWTKTDRNGGKWGVDPTGIHIGSITVPLPNFAFAGPTGRRDENNAKVRAFNETNAQAKRMELEETFESRAKAMRKRKDAQRDTTTRVVRDDH